MRLSFAAFLVSLAGFAFALGVVVGAYEIFPYQYIKYAINSVEAVFADRERLIDGRPVGFLGDRRNDDDGVVVRDAERMQPGLTLLSGFFDGSPGLRLVRADGGVVRDWPASFSTLFPDPAHIAPASEVPATDLNAAVHGMWMERDGAVVFNFDGKGTVKLDRCGAPVWTLPRMTHHSIDRAADGSYWIPSRYWRTEPGAGRALLGVPRLDDTLLHIAADGRVLEELSLPELLIDDGHYALLVPNGLFPVNMNAEDVGHLNDIEVLDAGMAAAFGDFEAGDLLLSLRHLNLLAVVRPSTAEVLWYQSGPWLRQHDPDFQSDGTITVYNNNSDDTKHGSVLGGSNLMVVDPNGPAGRADRLFDDGVAFFTNTQGKHQRLANGNWLIAEYYGGRAFEVTPDGDVVWSLVNGYDEASVAKLSGAIRYPDDYLEFDADDWRCPAP